MMLTVAMTQDVRQPAQRTTRAVLLTLIRACDMVTVMEVDLGPPSTSWAEAAR
jgi:hypothetical protein